MTITAKVVAHSVCFDTGKPIVTMIWRYPRFIHAEIMTHRQLNKNASSSRAIPVKRLLAAIIEDMAMPVYWGSNQPGMQAGAELTGWRLKAAKLVWRASGFTMVGAAWLLSKIGLHKQIANRVIEPWSHISVVVTATEWDNLWELRCHKDAQPEFQELANTARQAISESTPKILMPGEWHLPFVTSDELQALRYQFGPEQLRQSVEPWIPLIAASGARCARTSYDNHDGSTTNLVKDRGLYDKLVGSRPLHASPTEHQATPSADRDLASGNLRGWYQWRKIGVEKSQHYETPAPSDVIGVGIRNGVVFALPSSDL